jgi:hypothetical protein
LFRLCVGAILRVKGVDMPVVMQVAVAEKLLNLANVAITALDGVWGELAREERVPRQDLVPAKTLGKDDLLNHMGSARDSLTLLLETLRPYLPPE